jgi:hypothetical protein
MTKVNLVSSVAVLYTGTSCCFGVGQVETGYLLRYLGGSRVAKIVAAAAAKHLTPVTLEVRHILQIHFPATDVPFCFPINSLEVCPGWLFITDTRLTSSL